MFQRLPIALAQVKAANTSENLLNEIRQVILFFESSKRNDSKSIWEYNDFSKGIILNSTNSKTSDTHRLLLNLADKVNLKRSDKYVALSNLTCTIHGKIWKKIRQEQNKISTPTWNEEFELPDGSYSISDIQDYFK